MAVWIDPTIRWTDEITQQEHFERLSRNGEMLAAWPPAFFERTPTYCVRLADHYCVWQPDVGGMLAAAAEPALTLHPFPETDRSFFWTLVSRSWLPVVYPLWGRQVLHTSAVIRTDGVVIAFAGESGVGKSTTAFALAQRPGWKMLADDTLAFSLAPDTPVSIRLHPLRLQSRLRPDAAFHFGKPPGVEESFSWPDDLPMLKSIYILNGVTGPARPTVDRAALAESYAFVLRQAHAMSLSDAALNQQLMSDYATLAATVEVFRLTYRKSFDCLNETLDCIESHTRECHEGGDRSGEPLETATARPPA